MEEALLRQVTAVIKTFGRPQILRRLVASIKRLYPTLRIIVVDDSHQPIRLEGVETIAMPYDSGVSAGRNAGLRHVTTKYVLILDDDLVFFRGTGLGEAVELMERHPEIDIMGGRWIQLPFFWTPHPGRIFHTNAAPLSPIGSTIGKLTVCAKVHDFFIARRDRLLLVPWDPDLKRLEHADFFTRALGVLTTVYNPDLRCFHARTPFDHAYMKQRLDVAADRRVLEERYPVGLAPLSGAR